MNENRQHSSEEINKYPTLNQVFNSSSPLNSPIDYGSPLEIEPPPSVYHLDKGKTFLAKELGVIDNKSTHLVNQFLIDKIRSEGYKDHPKAYRRILKGLIKQIGLTPDHQGNLLVDKLYEYILSNNLDPKDFPVLLNTLIRVQRNVRG